MAMTLMAATTASEPSAPPDPATLRMPDMTPTRDRRVIANGWVHFYFHKEGVSYAQAYADFADCYRFMPPPGMWSQAPTFVPWGSRPGSEAARPPVGNYGLVGGLVAGLVSGPLERRAWQSRLRRCLEPRGYVRYPLAPEPWRQLIDNHSARGIAMQALAASGPKPDLPVVTR